MRMYAVDLFLSFDTLDHSYLALTAEEAINPELVQGRKMRITQVDLPAEHYLDPNNQVALGKEEI